jgi:type IV fimbrial biogenesis protein FimT
MLCATGPKSQIQGFSLVEAVVVLLVMGALAAAMAPGFAQSRRGSALLTSVNQMVGAIHFARSASILRGIPTVLCLSADGERCVGPGEPARGWLIFYDIKQSMPPRRDESDTLIRRTDLTEDVSVKATRATLTFWPTSRSGTSGTFTFCHVHLPGRARAVVVSQTGRPRIADTSEQTECTL